MDNMNTSNHLTVTSALSFIGPGEKRRSLGRDYHPLCLKCQRCNRQLTAGQHAEVQKQYSYTNSVYMQIQL